MKRLAVSPSGSEVDLPTPPKRRKLFLPLLFRKISSSPSTPTYTSSSEDFHHHHDLARSHPPPWSPTDRKSLLIPSSYPYEDAIPLPKPNRKSMVETPSRSMTMTAEHERPRRPRARSSFDRTFSSSSTPTERNFSVPYI